MLSDASRYVVEKYGGSPVKDLQEATDIEMMSVLLQKEIPLSFFFKLFTKQKVWTEFTGSKVASILEDSDKTDFSALIEKDEKDKSDLSVCKKLETNAQMSFFAKPYHLLCNWGIFGNVTTESNNVLNIKLLKEKINRDAFNKTVTKMKVDNSHHIIEDLPAGGGKLLVVSLRLVVKNASCEVNEKRQIEGNLQANGDASVKLKSTQELKSDIPIGSCLMYSTIPMFVNKKQSSITPFLEKQEKEEEKEDKQNDFEPTEDYRASAYLGKLCVYYAKKLKEIRPEDKKIIALALKTVLRNPREMDSFARIAVHKPKIVVLIGNESDGFKKLLSYQGYMQQTKLSLIHRGPLSDVLEHVVEAVSFFNRKQSDHLVQYNEEDKKKVMQLVDRMLHASQPKLFLNQHGHNGLLKCLLKCKFDSDKNEWSNGAVAELSLIYFILKCLS